MALALISDFTGADENPLSEGGNWAALNTSGTGHPLQRVSNQVRGSASGTNNSYWTPANFGPDLEAYATLVTASTAFVGIAVRIQGEGGSGTWDGYLVVVNTSTLIQVVTNAATTTLINQATAFAVGDKVGVRIRGSTIQAWKQASGSSDWNIVCTAVDTTYASAGKIGLQVSNAGTPGLDDFYAGPMEFFFGADSMAPIFGR